jgi:hypothetical protein
LSGTDIYAEDLVFRRTAILLSNLVIMEVVSEGWFPGVLEEIS